MANKCNTAPRVIHKENNPAIAWEFQSTRKKWIIDKEQSYIIYQTLIQQSETLIYKSSTEYTNSHTRARA